MRRLISMLLVSGSLGSLASAGPALAAAEPLCGTTPPGATQPAKATLSLAETDAETVTAALYGRRTGVKHLAFVYTVAGCLPADTLEPPQDPPPIGPPKDVKVDTIPKGVIRIDGTPQIDGHQYVVRMQVFTNPPEYIDANPQKTMHPKFGPGTYGGFVRLDANWMHRTGTPVVISRSENRWLFVLGAAAVGALLGFAFFMLLHAFSRAELLAGPGRIVIAGLISLGVGVYVAYTTNYLNQDVWTFGANTVAMLTAAFTASTSGHLVTGLLGKVYDDHAKVNPPAEVRPEHAARPGMAGVRDRIVHPIRTTKAAKLKGEPQNEDEPRVEAGSTRRED